MNIQTKIKYILFLSSLIIVPQKINAAYCFKICPPSGCDIALQCVMQKHKMSLKARLDDLIDTIAANTKQTKHQTKIIEQELLAYKRLLERVKKEAISLKEGEYLTRKIKENESLGITLDTIQKGKE